MSCVNCSASVNAKGVCEHCGTIAQEVRLCSDCPHNRNRYKIISGPAYEKWFDDDGKMVRQFAVTDDGVTQSHKEVKL